MNLKEHGCVRVSYKSTLTDCATDTEAEFKPLLPAAAPGAQRQTDPAGIQFMLKFPSISNHPGFEDWEGTDRETNSADASWNRTKVKNDVMEVAKVEKFNDQTASNSSHSIVVSVTQGEKNEQ